MRVAYDYQIFSAQFYGGISRYFYNLANTLSQSSQIDVAILAPLYHNSYLKSAAPAYVKGFSIPPIIRANRISKQISSLLTPMAMRCFRPDIIHETYYSLNPYVSKRASYVITIHDMLHEKYPSMLPDADRQAQAKKTSIDRADLIICVSENTRQDLLNLYNISEDRTATVYHGYELPSMQRGSPHDGALGKHQKPTQAKEYILYVGTRWKYKNFDNLLRAYSRSPWLMKNFNLVCFGGGRFSTDEKRFMTALGVNANQVIQITGDDHRLMQAYQEAAAFVYPSLYEGFGMPLLEAMALDCPVICSNTSSIPEVGGNAAEYFDPIDSEDIAAAIERVLNSRERRAALIQLGRQQYLRFSWKKCAQETLDIYQKIG